MFLYYDCKPLQEGCYTKTKKGKVGNADSLTFEATGGEKIMPIGGWWGPYQPKCPICDLSDIRFYQKIKDAGVNFITVSPDNYAENKQAALKGLQHASDTGLGIFVHDSKLKEINDADEMKLRLDEYNWFPCVIGYHLQDEPKPGEIHFLKKSFDAYEKTGDERPLFVNLFPAGIHEYFGTEGNAEGYEEYLDEFFKNTKPQLLSYDFYPFSFKDEGTNSMKVYFKNFSLVRKYAKIYHIPFWVFVQTGWWEKGGATVEDRWPTKEELHWNVHTSLAFGAKAIQYFTLIQPEEYCFYDGVTDYRKIGLIGFDGQENQWYPIVRDINRHIAAVGKILVQSEHDGVIGVGEWSDRYLGEERLTSYKELLGAYGGDAIVGCFNYQGKTALYLVNNATTKEACVRLHFDCVRGFEVTVDGEKTELCGQYPVFILKKGQGVLILLK